MGLPDMIATDDLELRRWNGAFVPEMVNAVNASRRELEFWMPWAQNESEVDDMRIIFSKAQLDFDLGKAWNYGLFEVASGELVGSAGLHREDDPDCPEIGYWVRSDRTRLGYATQAARALAVAALTSLLDVQQVKICMDRANVASTAVARKLGFRLVGEEALAVEATAHTGTGLVWVLGRRDVLIGIA